MPQNKNRISEISLIKLITAKSETMAIWKIVRCPLYQCTKIIEPRQQQFGCNPPQCTETLFKMKVPFFCHRNSRNYAVESSNLMAFQPVFVIIKCLETVACACFFSFPFSPNCQHKQISITSISLYDLLARVNEKWNVCLNLTVWLGIFGCQQ